MDARNSELPARTQYTYPAVVRPLYSARHRFSHGSGEYGRFPVLGALFFGLAIALGYIGFSPTL